MLFSDNALQWGLVSVGPNMRDNCGSKYRPRCEVPNPELSLQSTWGLNMKDYNCSHVSVFERYKDRWQSKGLRLSWRLEVNNRDNTQGHWTTLNEIL